MNEKRQLALFLIVNVNILLHAHTLRSGQSELSIVGGKFIARCRTEVQPT